MMSPQTDGRVGAPVGGERVGTRWRIFLWAAALFNFAVGGAGLLMADATTDERIISVLVVCFGLIYAIVARDARRFSPVLWAGVIGKVGVVALLVPVALGPPIDMMLAGVLATDTLFAIGFVIFLMRRIDSSL